MIIFCVGWGGGDCQEGVILAEDSPSEMHGPSAHQFRPLERDNLSPERGDGAGTGCCMRFSGRAPYIFRERKWAITLYLVKMRA